MTQSLSRRIALIDRLIIVVAIIAGILLAVHIWMSRQPAFVLSLPQPFVFVPDTTPPLSSPESSGRKPSLRELSVAESCLVEGSRQWDRGNLIRAELWFQRAVAVSHGDSRYVQALASFQEHLDNRKRRAELTALMRSGEADRAWQLFSNEAMRDPRFFADTASRFARELNRAGEVSSAVVVLQTYCRLKPEDASSRALLEQLILALRQEQEQRRPWYDF